MAITRCTCIIAAVIVSLIVAAGVGLSVCLLTSSDSTNHSDTVENPASTTEANQLSGWPVNYSAGLIIRTDFGVRAYSHYEDTSVQLVRVSVNVVDCYKNETLYYTESKSYGTVVSLSKSYSSLKYPGDNWFVNALAVDYVTEKLYVYDQEASKIDFFDIQGKYMGIVLSDLHMVQDIALDPRRGLMFILQKSRILQASMDGKNLEEIVKDTAISAIAVDLFRGILYWSKGNQIMAYDYFVKHTNTQAVLVNGSILISSLSVLNENLYFASRQSKMLSHGLFSCTIQPRSKGKCTDVRSQTFHENPRQLKAFDMLELNTIANPCANANGGCQQLCVRASFIGNNRGYTCQCEIGWQLTHNLRTCTPVDEYTIYVRGYNVRGRILDLMKQSFVDVIRPQRLNIDSLQYRNMVDFDYNARKGYLVYADDYKLWRLDLNGVQEQQLLEEALKYRMYPAVDYIADQLYYLKVHFNGVNSSYLMVRRLDSFGTFENQKIIYTFSKEQRPQALVVQPNIGYVFFTVYDESNRQAAIYRINSDGTGLKAFEVKDVKFSVNEIDLGFDYRMNRLYWFNKERTQVQQATWNGFNFQIVDVSAVKDPVSINIYYNSIYVGNRTGIWRLDKMTGEFAERILSTVGQDEKEKVSMTKEFGVSLQPINDDHPCVIENGGCERYCFGVQLGDMGKLSKVCGCNENQNLREDAKTCHEIPT